MSTAQDLPLGPVPSAVDALDEPHDLVEAARPLLELVPDLEALEHAEPVTVPDDAEFDEIIRRATPRLVRYAHRRLNSFHEAEEIAQEALLRTFQHRAKLATEDDVMAWATLVTSRLVIDRVRVRSRSIAVAEVPEGTRPSRDTAEIAEARAEARLALDALDSLPGRQASVLWAREVEGLRYDEIGARLGLSEPTVRSLLHRARKALRKEYAARGGTIPVSGVLLLGPWLKPLRHLGALRKSTVGVLGSAALGVMSLGIFSLGLPQADAPSRAIAPVPAILTGAKAPTAEETRSAPAAHEARPSDGPAAVAPHRSTRVPLAPRTVTCGADAGINCRPPSPDQPRIDVTLPFSLPVVGGGVGVGADQLPCDSLPSTPVARCTTASSHDDADQSEAPSTSRTP